MTLIMGSMDDSSCDEEARYPAAGWPFRCFFRPDLGDGGQQLILDGAVLTPPILMLRFSEVSRMEI